VRKPPTANTSKASTATRLTLVLHSTANIRFDAVRCLSPRALEVQPRCAAYPKDDSVTACDSPRQRITSNLGVQSRICPQLGMGPSRHRRARPRADRQRVARLLTVPRRLLDRSRDLGEDTVVRDQVRSSAATAPPPPTKKRTATAAPTTATPTCMVCSRRAVEGRKVYGRLAWTRSGAALRGPRSGSDHGIFRQSRQAVRALGQESCHVLPGIRQPRKNSY